MNDGDREAWLRLVEETQGTVQDNLDKIAALEMRIRDGRRLRSWLLRRKAEKLKARSLLMLDDNRRELLRLGLPGNGPRLGD